MNTLKSYRRLFLVLSIIAFVLIKVADSHLTTSLTPSGIVSFEFCGFNDACPEAVAAWGTMGSVYAAFSLGVDYLFLVGYAGLFFVLGLMVSSSQGKVGQMMPYLAIIAGIFDAIENYDLIRTLLGMSDGMIAGISASIKFALLGVVVIWLLYSWIKQRRA